MVLLLVVYVFGFVWIWRDALRSLRRAKLVVPRAVLVILPVMHGLVWVLEVGLNAERWATHRLWDRWTRAQVEEIMGLGIREVRVGDGRITVDAMVSEEVTDFLADLLVRMLDDNHAPNCVECSIFSPVHGPLIMTIARGGEHPSPLQLKAKAEAERDTARAELAALKEQF